MKRRRAKGTLVCGCKDADRDFKEMMIHAPVDRAISDMKKYCDISPDIEEKVRKDALYQAWKRGLL